MAPVTATFLDGCCGVDLCCKLDMLLTCYRYWNIIPTCIIRKRMYCLFSAGIRAAPSAALVKDATFDVAMSRTKRKLGVTSLPARSLRAGA